MPYTLYTKDYSNNLKSLFKIPKKGTNRQNLRKIYSRVGCIYLTKTKTILKNKSIYGKKIKSILIPHYRSFDIDTIHDWDLLESWIKTKKININFMKTGDNITTKRGNWKFDKNVSKNFVNHITRSVPGYADGHNLICQLSDFFFMKIQFVMKLAHLQQN